ADLIGPELIQNALGDGAEGLLDRIVIVDPHETIAGTYTATISVVLNGDPPQLPLIGDSVMLDFGGLQSGGSGTSDGELQLATLTLTLDSLSLSVQLLPGLGLLFSPDLLTPLDGQDAVVLDLGAAVSFLFDQNGVHVTAPALQLPKCGLGQTGIQL